LFDEKINQCQLEVCRSDFVKTTAHLFHIHTQ